MQTDRKRKWESFLSVQVFFFQLGHEECLQIVKAETLTVESSLLDVVGAVRRTKRRIKW